MRKTHPVIDRNIDFIKAHLKTHTLFWIGKQIGIHYEAMYRYAKIYGFKGCDQKKVLSIKWTPHMLQTLRNYFSTSFNKELADELGVSLRTLIRKAREFGLQKEPGFLDKNRKLISRMAQAARPKNDAATIARITQAGIPYRFSSTCRPSKKVDGKKVLATRRANAEAVQQALKKPY
jgi:hypothetical protein